jgi:two-component system, NarL family, nitrate/nitrite response regulator NarL
MSVDSGASFNLLTKREREIAGLVRSGLSNKSIAHSLSLSEGTIKSHLHKIFQKLNIRNRYGLIAALSDAQEHLAA